MPVACSHLVIRLETFLPLSVPQNAPVGIVTRAVAPHGTLKKDGACIEARGVGCGKLGRVGAG